VSSECKAVFAVASFHNLSAQLSDSRVHVQVYFSLLETVLRECLTFPFFTVKVILADDLFLNYF